MLVLHSHVRKGQCLTNVSLSSAQAEHTELQTYAAAVTAAGHEAHAEMQRTQHETQQWQVCAHCILIL